jgi:hypothetical protein
MGQLEQLPGDSGEARFDLSQDLDDQDRVIVSHGHSFRETVRSTGMDWQLSLS